MNNVTKIEEDNKQGGAMALIGKAISDGASVEQIEKLMELHERIEANQAKKAFVVAMNKFKAEAPSITKNKKVKFGGTSYEHATLDNVINTATPKLSENGLSHKWVTEQFDSGTIRVTCVITHELGHGEETWLEAKPDSSGSKNSIQQIGSTVTYLQRYTFLSATGLAVEGMDNDGAVKQRFITEEQFLELNRRLDETNSNKHGFCKHFKIESIDKLPSRDFGRADTLLKGKEGVVKGEAS